MLEKRINKNQKSKIFDTYEDAKFYQCTYGGDINFIKQYESATWTAPTNPLDKGLDNTDWWDPDDNTIYKNELIETGHVLYVLNISAECNLNNGFRYIKELIMQHHNFYLNNCYKILKKNDVEVYTCKTDAFTIPANGLDKAKELLNWENGLGSWRLSKIDEIKFPCEDLRLALKDNKLIEITEFKTYPLELTTEDEYNVDKLCEYFENIKKVMIRGEYPGSGKSYACEHMVKRGHKVLFVCPTNKLTCKYGQNGCTINKFFGIGLSEHTKLAKFNDTEYDTIVFDEILFCNIRMLSRIHKYCNDHPDKICIATGDSNQLKTIDIITNLHDYDEYYNRCIDIIFPNNMYFHENKRLKKQEDKEVLKSFKHDIFNEHIPIETTIRKYFKITKNNKTINNIAYRNITCASVSKRVRNEMLNKTSAYEVGELLICRHWFKTKKLVFNVNYEYTITAVQQHTITLNGIDLPIDIVNKYFIFNYCRTAHSFQGSTIDDAITVYDWKFIHVDRRWIYTAVTRATDLKKVCFYDYQEANEDVDKMNKYFQKKVDSYKSQDRKAKRPINDNTYVNTDWLNNCVGKYCSSCGDQLTYDRTHGKIECNITAQRVNNNEAHHIDNIIAYCVYCNCYMSNREND